jgi:hypothetical protein
VVAKPRDSLDIEVLQSLQPVIVPGKIRAVRALGRNRLPEHRMAQGTNAKLGDAIKIIDTIAVTGFQALIAEVFTNSGECTFQPAPKL